jgi:hypothetical protein
MSAFLLPRSLAAMAAAGAVLLGAAGCGSSAGSSSGANAGVDPAASLPASAPLYVEAQLRPEGDLKANVDAVARKVLRTNDPGQKVVDLLDRALNAKAGTDYKADIEPWLGNRAGLAITALGAGGARPDVVAAIASNDDGTAQAFLDKEQAGNPTTQRDYRGVTYRVDARQDLAAAVVDHAVLVGTERGFKAAVDATRGDELADAPEFKRAREAVGTDGFGFLYVDPSRLLDVALSRAGGTAGAQGPMLKGLLAGSGTRSIAARLDVASDALRIDAAALGLKTGAGAGDGPGAAAAVPADAWLSLGVGDVGGAVRRALAQATQGGAGAAGGLDPGIVLQQLKGQLGFDLEKDLLSWMGDAAVFVRGTSMADLDGALVVHSKDPAASRRAIGELRRLLATFGAKPGALHGGAGADGLSLQVGSGHTTIEIAARGDRFVIAYGPRALDAALNGGGATLGGTQAFKTVAGLLGGAKPSLFVDTPAVVRFIGSLAGSSPSFAKAKPTLHAFGPAAAGVSSDGDVTHLKLAVQVP